MQILFPFEPSEPQVYFKSAEAMSEVVDNSVGVIITSPPYGQIKDYGIADQIGFDDSFPTYFARLKTVWKECYRVLQPQRRMIINVGDQYLRANEYGRYRVLSIAAQIIQDCQELGFDYLGDIIWQKISTTNTSGGCSLMGSLFYPPNGLATFDYEHILIFKKIEGKETEVPREIKELSKLSMDEWKIYFNGHWRFMGIQQKVHAAMFPDELPYRLIRMFSFIGEIVLDPFCGSGTTLKLASALFRPSIGYEINPSFATVIQEKIHEEPAVFHPDFLELGQLLYQNQAEFGYLMDFDFSKQKSIFSLHNSDGFRCVIDLITFTVKDFDSPLYLTRLKAKLQENNVLNFIEKKGKWQEIQKFILLLAYPEEFSLEIENFINENSYQNLEILSYEKCRQNLLLLFQAI